MTRAQASYLKTLSEKAGEEFDPALTKAEASLRIEELQKNTGRGLKTTEQNEHQIMGAPVCLACRTHSG